MSATIKNRTLGLKIGAVFSIISFLLTFTFIIPILSVLPGCLVELIASKLVNNTPYSNVGKLTILIFVVILLTFIVAIIFATKILAEKKLKLRKFEVILAMFIFYFIIHPLGFYIYWGIFLHFVRDGQLIFSAVTSFPYSSLAFILLGFLIDLTWTKFYNPNTDSDK